jgi:hypothetical protein
MVNKKQINKKRFFYPDEFEKLLDYTNRNNTMVVDTRYNNLVTRYNELLHKTALRKDKEIHKEGEAIHISEEGISLSSNVVPIHELTGLLVELLKDKIIKNYIEELKIKRVKKDINYVG